MAKKQANTQRNTKRGVIAQSKAQKVGQPAKWMVNKQAKMKRNAKAVVIQQPIA